ncbi:Hypothetical predicted protein [Octopus vulgaris]|uniref:RFX1-4/6/8-like BCD domain-containing protein n=1 Tax=Octopus vulgaris TaxID=6645 RepID=A0AA36BI25_OCTVU|nr:Hypothetical predicted protein [Octopus vulgaris]
MMFSADQFFDQYQEQYILNEDEHLKPNYQGTFTQFAGQHAGPKQRLYNHPVDQSSNHTRGSFRLHDDQLCGQGRGLCMPSTYQNSVSSSTLSTLQASAQDQGSYVLPDNRSSGQDQERYWGVAEQLSGQGSRRSGIQTDRQTQKQLQITHTLQWFSGLNLKTESNSRRYSLSSKAGTLLPEFPDVRSLCLPREVDRHKVETLLLHFWQGTPKHLEDILYCDVIVDIVGFCDSILYQSAARNPLISQEITDVYGKFFGECSKDFDGDQVTSGARIHPHHTETIVVRRSGTDTAPIERSDGNYFFREEFFKKSKDSVSVRASREKFSNPMKPTYGQNHLSFSMWPEPEGISQSVLAGNARQLHPYTEDYQNFLHPRVATQDSRQWSVATGHW